MPVDLFEVQNNNQYGLQKPEKIVATKFRQKELLDAKLFS